MDYIVRSPLNKPDVVGVRYDCDCGCKPRARYQRGTAKAGHDHCCCGRAHFVEPQALHQMEAYLEQRRTSGEDVGLSTLLPWMRSILHGVSLSRSSSPYLISFVRIEAPH